MDDEEYTFFKPKEVKMIKAFMWVCLIWGFVSLMGLFCYAIISLINQVF